MVQGVSSDQEIGKNAAWARVSLPSSARDVLLEGKARRAPRGFVEIPVHSDTRCRCLAERIK